MAAIIGDGLSKLCSTCGKLCSLPCRIVSDVCGVTCRGISDVCSVTCGSPFCPFIVSAVFLNIPPIVAGVTNADYDCKGSLWLLVNLCFSAVNIGFAFYMAIKLQNQDDAELQDNKTALSRATHVLCYDPVTAVYIIIFTAFFSWLCVGINWQASGKIYGGDCDENINKPISTAIGCGFSFVFVGSMTLCCSLCIAGFDRRRYGNDDNVYQLTNDTSVQQETSTQVPIATPVINTTKPSSGDYGSTTPVSAEVLQPSAPLQPSKDSVLGDGKAKLLGSKVGGKIGKLFSVENKKQAALEKTGGKAGAAVGNSITAVKNFVSLKKAK